MVEPRPGTMIVSVGELRQLIREYSEAACRYEAAVIKSLKLSGVAGRMRRAACSDSDRPDADMRVGNEIYNVEIKASPRARMGGGSVGYSLEDGLFRPVGKNIELSESIATILNELDDDSLHSGLKSFISHLSKRSKKRFTDIPISGFDPAAWDEARDLGMLRPINRTFEGNIDVISNHYAMKNTHYIQIGGAGFFHLGNNPANLPIPKLEGRVQLEVALSKAGAKSGRSFAYAGMRIWARLLAGNKSPYTLDDPNSIKEMLATRDVAAEPTTKSRKRVA